MCWWGRTSRCARDVGVGASGMRHATLCCPHLTRPALLDARTCRCTITLTFYHTHAALPALPRSLPRAPAPLLAQRKVPDGRRPEDGQAAAP